MFVYIYYTVVFPLSPVVRSGVLVHHRRVVSHAISGTGTIDGNRWCYGGCGGRGSQKAVGLGTVTSTWHEGERQRGTDGNGGHSQGIWDVPASRLDGQLRIGRQLRLAACDTFPISVTLNENLSVVGATIEEGVESTDDEDEEARAGQNLRGLL